MVLTPNVIRAICGISYVEVFEIFMIESDFIYVDKI